MNDDDIIMKSFDDIFSHLITLEGGYVNNPHDKGGETKYGITVAVARANGYKGNMKNLSIQTAKNIYYKQYWLKNKCDKLPLKVAFHFFDACVNHGAQNAVRFLQRAVSVADDGIIGKITLTAVNNQSEINTVFRMNAERLSFYTKLSTFKTFGKGWINRIASNLKFGADL